MEDWKAQAEVREARVARAEMATKVKVVGVAWALAVSGKGVVEGMVPGSERSELAAGMLAVVMARAPMEQEEEAETVLETGVAAMAPAAMEVASTVEVTQAGCQGPVAEWTGGLAAAMAAALEVGTEVERASQSRPQGWLQSR